VAVKRQLKRFAENTLSRLAPVAWRADPRQRLLVLMYHRVLPVEHPDRAIEQPAMYVSPATLDMHVTILRRYFAIVHLDDWIRAAAERRPLPRRARALTFDDGWQDNFEYAFPILCRHSAPAMIFLVSALTGTSKEFWPNRLGRLLASSSPDSLPCALAEVLALVLGAVRAYGARRAEEIDSAIVLAKRLDEYEMNALIDVAMPPDSVAVGPRAVLNHGEVRAMAESGLVRFGSHTRTHYRFRGDIPRKVLEQEIAGSQADIGASVGLPADVFCYPNGDTTPEAVRFVRQHYLAAVTTREGWHSAGADPFLIRRIGVHEDIGGRPDAFVARISGWVR